MVNQERELTDNNILLKDIPRMANASGGEFILSKITPEPERQPLDTNYQREFNRQMNLEYVQVETYIEQCRRLERNYITDNLVQCFLMNVPNKEEIKPIICSQFGFSKITLIHNPCKGTGAFCYGPAFLINYYVQRGGRDTYEWGGKRFWTKITEWRPRPV